MQCLYALEADGALREEARPPVFTLLLEPLREKSLRARAKAVLHLQQGRPRTAATLAPLLGHAQQVGVVDDDRDLVPALRALHDSEDSIARELESIQHEMHGNKSATRLSASLAALREANLASRAAAARISATRPTFPALEKIRTDALAIWESLATDSERLEAALAPEPGPLPELRAIAKAEHECSAVEERLQSYLAGLREHLPEVDRQLEQAVDNYAPERIDRVDRAILRLGAYELLFDPSIPPGVAIDEAIELARAFGTSDSPRFVNGVLDRLPKSL